MIAGTPGVRKFGPKAQPRDIQVIDEHIDHPDRAVFFYVIIESFWKQGALAAVLALNELARIALPGWKALL